MGAFAKFGAATIPALHCELVTKLGIRSLTLRK
jgi:hypothetical protein